MKKLLFFGLFMLQCLYAETVWVKYGWQIFKIAGDAQTIAIGSAQVAGVPGSNASLWNPAYTSDVNNKRLLYAHHIRFAGIVKNDLIAFPIRITPRLSTEFTLIHQGVSGIPDTRAILLDWGLDGKWGTNDPGEGNGQLDDGERLDEDKIKHIHQRQLAVHLSTARRFQSMLIGIGVKGLYHSLGEHYASGIGFNFGMIKPVWSQAQVGITIHDVTTSWLVWDNGTVERIKPQIQAGFAQRINLTPISIGVTLKTDLVINSNGQSLSDDFQLKSYGGAIRFGVEITFRDKVLIRAGRNEVGMLAAGLGLNWTNLNIDYAFQLEPLLSGLGNSHYLSFSVDPRWLSTLVSTYL